MKKGGGEGRIPGAGICYCHCPVSFCFPKSSETEDAPLADAVHPFCHGCYWEPEHVREAAGEALPQAAAHLAVAGFGGGFGGGGGGSFGGGGASGAGNARYSVFGIRYSVIGRKWKKL